MMNLEHELIWMRRRDYVRQAELHRLSKLVTAYRPGKLVKLMAWTGRRLVALGEGLQTRAVAPVVAKSQI
jgi:hypothetical protein